MRKNKEAEGESLGGVFLNRVPRFSLSEVGNEKARHYRSRRNMAGRGNNR